MNQQMVDDMMMLSLRESCGRFGGKGGGVPGWGCSASLMMSVWRSPASGSSDPDAECVPFLLVELLTQGSGATATQSVRELCEVRCWCSTRRKRSRTRPKCHKPSWHLPDLSEGELNPAGSRPQVAWTVSLPGSSVKMQDGWGCNGI